jgi:hypothetical protein
MPNVIDVGHKARRSVQGTLDIYPIKTPIRKATEGSGDLPPLPENRMKNAIGTPCAEGTWSSMKKMVVPALTKRSVHNFPLERL